jgi:DNA-directed RNA polymerase subunit L
MITDIEYLQEKTSNKFKDDKVKFNIINDGNVHISFVNGIRRFIDEQSEGFIPDEFTNTKNSSIFNDDIIRQRITLMPYIFSEINKYTLTNLKIVLDVKNEKEHPISVKSSDFVFLYDGKEVDNVFSYQNILFLENIDPGEEISLEYTIKKELSAVHAALKHNCKNVYHFKRDEKAIEKLIKEKGLTDKKEINHFKVNTNIYEKNKIGKPKTYIYEVESNGVMSCIETLKLGLENIVKHIEHLEKYASEHIQNSDENPSVTILTLKNETHTIGNLFSEYYSFNAKLETCSYYIPHPLDNILLIKFIFKTEKDATIKNTLNIMNEENKKLITMYQTFLKAF